MTTALVVGLGVTGQALVEALRRHGHEVVAIDDQPTSSTRAAAAALGVDLVEAPDRAVLEALVRRADLVLPSPGVPDHHPLFATAAEAGVPVRSELDLAAAWEQRPFLAVTGTDGKTTVVSLVVAMLAASGVRAVEAGNTEVPLVAAIADPSPEVFVVEASSFRLAAIDTFHAKVGTWLNFAPDHQDAHADLTRYEAAKAKVFDAVEPDGLAVANVDDPVVSAHAKVAPRVETFGFGAGADWHVAGVDLCAPDGTAWIRMNDLWRTFPHDVSNFLAAGATAVGGGATLAGVAAAAAAFRGLPHRVSFVAESGGVSWYDDSKATAPHATLAAVAGFEQVVLIAGGRNKGLDLAALRHAAEHLRAVVAIGEAANDVEAAFAGRVPVVHADSMDHAVVAAHGLARPGDAVLLSPGCASFDWYGSYHERGDDFIRAVAELLGGR